jgi:hypothetical protein
MIPALICGTFAAATHWVAVPVARIIGDTEFRLRLDEYENTVRTLDEPQNEFPEGCRSAIVAPNRKLPHRIIWLEKKRCGAGMTVAFLVGTDVPLLHQGYVFRGYDDRNPSINQALRIESEWPYTRHIVGDWYRFADQPGF